MIKFEVSKYEEPDLLYDRIVLIEKFFIKFPHFKLELKGNLEFETGTTGYDPNDFSPFVPITFKLYRDAFQDISAYSNEEGQKYSNRFLQFNNGFVGLSGKKINWIEIYKERMRQDFEKFLDENIK